MKANRYLLWLVVGLITLTGALCSAQDSTITLYYGLEQSGVLCGFSKAQISHVTFDGRDAILLEDNNEIHFTALGAKVDATYNFTYHIDPATGRYFHHTSDIDQGTLQMGSDVTVLGDTIQVIGRPEPDTLMVAIDESVVLGNTRIFYHLLNDFARDTITKREHRVFIEMDGAAHDVLYTRTGVENLELAGRTFSAVALEVFDKTIGIKSNIWMDTESGYLLKGSFPNREVYLTDSTVVDRIGVGDLDDALFAKLGIQIPSIKDITYMKVKATMTPGGVWLTPESLNVRGQSFVGTVVDNNVEGVFEITHERYDGSEAPAFPFDYSGDTTLTEFLEPEDLIESDDSVLVRKAFELTEGAADSWEAMKRLSKWVSDEIAYDIPGGGTASNTYELRRGECGSHSRLLAAFCRAVGIPARMVWGCMYVPNHGGSFGQHAWTEVYMGEKGWIPVDATAEEIGYVDCSHIRIGIARSKAIMFNPGEMELLDFTCGDVTMATLASTSTDAGIPAEYQPYVGKYNAPMGVATVLVQNGSLAIDIPNRMVFELNDADEHGHWYFKLTELASVSFEEDETGSVVALTIDSRQPLSRKPADSTSPNPETVPEQYRDYVGKYAIPMQGVDIGIKMDQDQLKAEVPRVGLMSLEGPDESNRFIGRINDVTSLEFTFAVEGDLTRMTLNQRNRFPRIMTDSTGN